MCLVSATSAPWLTLEHGGKALSRGSEHIRGSQNCSWNPSALAPNDNNNVCALLLQVASEMGRMTLAWPVGKNIFLWHFYGLLQQVLDEASEIPSKQLCVPRRQQTVKHLKLRGLD